MRVHPQLDRGVVQASAVQVQAEAFFAGKCPGRREVFHRQNLALHGVFQGQQPGAGEMKIVGLDGGSHLIQVQRSVRLVVEGLRLDRAEHRRPAAFIFVGVCLLADDVFVAPFTVGHEAEQVAHGAGRHEQRGGKTETLGQPRFQPIDRRVFAVHVIAKGRAGHGVAHAGGGLGHGVTAQIDNRHDEAPND